MREGSDRRIFPGFSLLHHTSFPDPAASFPPAQYTDTFHSIPLTSGVNPDSRLIPYLSWLWLISRYSARKTFQGGHLYVYPHLVRSYSYAD